MINTIFTKLASTMKKSILLISFFLLPAFIDCTINDKYSNCYTDCLETDRTEVRCKDGTESSETGDDACLNNNGVECWFCDDE